MELAGPFKAVSPAKNLRPGNSCLFAWLDFNGRLSSRPHLIQTHRIARREHQERA
jgi:hypothetical protein